MAGIKELKLEEKEAFRKTLFSILRHIQNVQDNAFILANKLIDEGELDLARRLIQRIMAHDQSKFTPLEFKGLNGATEELKTIAIDHHRSVNPHHIQYHASVKDMSDLDIAEFCCDIKARSEEFGTSVMDYIKKFINEHEISTSSNFYKRAKYFFDLILDIPFK